METSVRVLPPEALDALVAALRERGYTVRGPVHRDGTVLFDEIVSADDLAVGRRIEQQPGMSRVIAGPDPHEVFAAVVGPDSVRSTVMPSRHLAVTADLGADGRWTFASPPLPDTKVAYLGVRACDLEALAIQDRVFGTGPVPDAGYLQRRANLFLVGVDCGYSAATCFCASMGTGPAVSTGADLRLSELDPEGDHRFLAESLTEVGADVLAAVSKISGPQREAMREDLLAATERTAQAASDQTRAMRQDAHDVLAANLTAEHWDEVAARCLTCANCTLVCPTCFCTTVEDRVALTGDHAERWRQWDSCFTFDHSHMGEGPVRATAASRYRQWLTHKLSTWVEQFGTSGCVGCGRCIAWCPVGIDIVEEVDVFAAAGGTTTPRPHDDRTPAEVGS